MSDRKVRDLLAELDRLAVVSKAPGVMSLSVRDVAENLRSAVDATEDPQIIRTVEELEALDPDTLLLDGVGEGFLYFVRHYFAGDKVDRAIYQRYLPAVVITPAAQVRAARKALEEA